MKKLLLALMATACMTTAMAQDNGQGNRGGRRMNRTEMIEKRTNSMTEKYQLNEEQTAKVKALNEKYMGQMGPRRGENAQRPQKPETDGQTSASAQNKPEGNMPEAGHGNRNGRPHGGQHGRRGGFGRFNMSKYNEELKTILTESQYKAYEADMEKWKERKSTAKIQ